MAFGYARRWDSTVALEADDDLGHEGHRRAYGRGYLRAMVAVGSLPFVEAKGDVGYDLTQGLPAS